MTFAVRRERTWYRAAGRSMGAIAEVLIDGPRSLVDVAFRRLEQLEQSWSRFRPSSELNAAHRQPGAWHVVSPELLAALSWCRRMFDETGGVFDPSIRASLEAIGYDRDFAEIVDGVHADEVVPTSPAPGIAGLSVDRRGSRVRIDAGTTIDLGGIGKGLAADVVAREVLRAGATSIYVSLGGDIHAAGEPPESGAWEVPVMHPVTDERIAAHDLTDGALVMSTVALRRWRCGSTDVHHIIDPRTGCSAQTDVVAVAVAARSAARAEALAKSAIVLGSAAGATLLVDAGVTAWIVTDDGVTSIAEQDPR